uniref:Uncharacterized protein n=1 Tax=Pithovirus LCPAC404 TaxID=2506597 RepID=A0A481ZCG0_9VIRU|nr:MAG: hypothetical protein LCPAC404_03270 [Pithovirus LCPAC404]
MFVIYAIIYDVILYLILKKPYDPISRIPGFFIKFYGWILGRLALGDEDPLRRIQNTSRTPRSEKLDYPKYPSPAHELFPFPMKHIDGYLSEHIDKNN